MWTIASIQRVFVDSRRLEVSDVTGTSFLQMVGQGPVEFNGRTVGLSWLLPKLVLIRISLRLHL
jgi:hypothetical protein